MVKNENDRFICGCGGMSLGFQNAGFEMVAAYDNWEAAANVYRKNFAHPVYCCDVERGYCVITTTHNPGQAMELNDMVLMMSDEGQQFGKATDIITEENLKRTYDLEATIEQGRYRRYASFGDTENLHRLVY